MSCLQNVLVMVKTWPWPAHHLGVLVKVMSRANIAKMLYGTILWLERHTIHSLHWFGCVISGSARLDKMASEVKVTAPRPNMVKKAETYTAMPSCQILYSYCNILCANNWMLYLKIQLFWCHLGKDISMFAGISRSCWVLGLLCVAVD